MVRRGVRALFCAALLCAALLCAACGGVELHARAVQPRPAPEAATARLLIRVQYLHLEERVILENSARLRAAADGAVEADVTVMHVWLDRADCSQIGATLSAAGASHPGELADARAQRVFIDGDRYLAQAAQAGSGRNEGRVALCRFRFAVPGLGAAESLSLIVSLADGDLRYTWRFAPGRTRLWHFGPMRQREDPAFYEP